MNNKIKFISILLYSINVSATLVYAQAIEHNPIVTLPYGKIRGHVLETANDNTYYAFQDIPFADWPVGELRFKEPVAPRSWIGTLDTTKSTYVCYQQSPLNPSENLIETEACLNLNVYSPVQPGSSAALPVLVWIYGGGFTGGDASFQRYGPQFFIDYDIIVVTVNYRLGPLGFLTTEDGVIPGNLGIKDQNFALRWVKDNINLFGGDPEKVTISGESAGAMSVGFHLISKESEGLFRGAILESGTSICPGTRQPFAKYIAFEFGRALDPNFTSEDSTELLNLLQNAKVSDIIQASRISIPEDKASGAGAWVPVIEPENVEGAFITGPMQEDIKNGNINQVPILLGFNSEEEIIFLASPSGYNSLKNTGIYIDEHLDSIFNNKLTITDDNISVAGDEIRKIYTDGKFQDDFAALVRYSSDSAFTTPIIRHADLQSSYTDVFLYQFSYKGLLGGLTVNIEGVPEGGVGHSEEVHYIWSDGGSSDISKFPVDDILTHHRILKLWTNFVKYSNPTPEKDPLLEEVIWTPVTPSKLSYLNINKTLEVRTDPKEYIKWKEVIDTYAIPPLPVY